MNLFLTNEAKYWKNTNVECVDVLAVNGDVNLGSEGRVRVMRVEHIQGPIDNSLYAQVKPQRTSTTDTALTNGVCELHEIIAPITFHCDIHC